MTDARLPERWLNDRRFARLSDAGFRLYAVSLMWAVANRTDGILAVDDLPLIPGVNLGRADELARAGLWEQHEDGWLVVDYDQTQTSSAQLESAERARVLARERKARQRAREKEQEPPPDPVVLRDVTRDNTGQDRPGQATTGSTKGRPEQNVACERCSGPVEDVRAVAGWPDCGECARSASWPPVRQPGAGVA